MSSRTENCQVQPVAQAQQTVHLFGLQVDQWSDCLDRLLDGESMVGMKLSRGVLKKAARFVRKEDARRAAGAEILCRMVLNACEDGRLTPGLELISGKGETLLSEALWKREKREDSTDNEDLIDRIVRDQFGKPTLEGRDDLHFNLSHSGNLVFCAVDTKPVGVDVELIRPIDLAVAESCYTPGERKHLQQHGETHLQLQEFYRLWTLKESLLKWLGTGMSRSPRTVELRPVDPDRQCWVPFNYPEGGVVDKAAVAGSDRSLNRTEVGERCECRTVEVDGEWAYQEGAEDREGYAAAVCATGPFTIALYPPVKPPPSATVGNA